MSQSFDALLQAASDHWEYAMCSPETEGPMDNGMGHHGSMAFPMEGPAFVWHTSSQAWEKILRYHRYVVCWLSWACSIPQQNAGDLPSRLRNRVFERPGLPAKLLPLLEEKPQIPPGLPGAKI